MLNSSVAILEVVAVGPWSIEVTVKD